MMITSCLKTIVILLIDMPQIAWLLFTEKKKFSPEAILPVFRITDYCEKGCLCPKNKFADQEENDLNNLSLTLQRGHLKKKPG